MKTARGRLVDTLFAPTTNLMDRLPYATKFMVIGFVLAFPLAILGYININTLNEQVVFNKKENVGVAYINPVKAFLHQLQRHRVLTAAVLSGDRQSETLLTSARADADQLATEISALEGSRPAGWGESYGSLLKTTEAWKSIKQEWADLKDKRFSSAIDADAAHEALTTKVADLIANQAANYSNLILDPDLDSYYLMDAFIAKYAALAQTVTKGTTLSINRGDDAKAQERQLELASSYKLALATANGIRDVNLTTSFKETVNPENPNRGDKLDMKDNLQGKVADMVTTVSSHSNEVVRNAFVATSAMTPTQVRAATLQTLEVLKSIYALWDATGPELSWLVSKRVVEKYGQRRSLSGILLVSIVFVVTLLFVGFFLSVRRSVEAIGQAASRMIQGTMEVFTATSNDELGSVLNRYNEINAALVEARTLREKVEGDNRELQANIMDLLQVVSMASDGDLTAKAHVTAGALGNVADAFNQLQDSMQRLVGEIRKQQQQTSEVVQQIRVASQNMAQGATTQARELVSASQFVERVSTEIEKVSTNARNAADAARRTENSAVEGSKAVDDVISGMEQLRANVQAGAKKIKSLGDRSMEINSIVNVINRISEQTNMLALNAAIEAARAGEHGRGFSVVAEEVRKLAERTAQATQDIERLVKAIQVETSETVSAIEVQTNVVEKESAVVGQAGSSLNRIREVSTTSAELVTEISTVAQQQAEGTRSVVKVMGEISNIAQQTQVGAQNTVASMIELTKVQDALAQSIRRFKLN